MVGKKQEVSEFLKEFGLKETAKDIAEGIEDEFVVIEFKPLLTLNTAKVGIPNTPSPGKKYYDPFASVQEVRDSLTGLITFSVSIENIYCGSAEEIEAAKQAYLNTQ